MKNLFILGSICLFLCACGKSVYHTKHQKTPNQMVMSHSEKEDVNYDAREARKVIEKNAKNKEANQKNAEKQRKKDIEEMNKVNANTSKVKRKKTAEAFSFY